MNIDFKGRGRIIVALVAGILFLVLEAVFPELPFSEEQVILFMGLIFSYIIGEGIGGRVIGSNLMTMLKSQKFQALLAGIIMNVIKGFFPSLPISDEQLVMLLVAIMTFIVSAGIQKAVDKPASEEY